MLKITRNNVNDRNSNRADRVLGILSADLIGGLLQHLRCLMHPVCSVSRHVVHEIGCKRFAYLPISASPAPPQGWQRQATATARGARSAG